MLIPWCTWDCQHWEVFFKFFVATDHESLESKMQKTIWGSPVELISEARWVQECPGFNMQLDMESIASSLKNKKTKQNRKNDMW